MSREFHVLIDNAVRLDFFSRIYLTEERTPSIVFHANLYTWLKASILRMPGQHLLLKRERTPRLSGQPSIEEIKNETNIRSGIHFPLGDKQDELWVFSGFQYAACELIPYYNKVRYFEIGNFPNRYQSSYSGVNADADYNEQIHALRQTYPVSVQQVSELAQSLLNFRPPHVDVSIIGKALEQGVNLLGYYCLKTAAPHSAPMKQLSTALAIRRVRQRIRTYESVPLPKRFNLFIAQVEQDSQTLFQSEVDSLTAIKNALIESKNSHIPLIVRLHPGEKNLRALERTIEYCEQKDILISNQGNLLETAIKAEAVFTINSTGGLQCLLFGKVVTTYGRSFYQNWDATSVWLYHEHILREFKDVQ